MRTPLRTLPLESDSRDFSPLASFAWPGGYPIYYLCADNAAICAKCANNEGGCEFSELSEDRETRLISAEVNWESELYCENCSEKIESAYGEDAEVSR